MREEREEEAEEKVMEERVEEEGEDKEMNEKRRWRGKEEKQIARQREKSNFLECQVKSGQVEDQGHSTH